MTVPSPSVSAPWLIPPGVLAAYLRLQDAIDDAGTIPCRTSDPEAWWPDESQGFAARMAVDACSTCDARQPCLDYAVAADERWGVWGGTLPGERRTSGREAA